MRLVAPHATVIDRVGFQGAPAGFFAGTGLSVPAALPTGQFAWIRRISGGVPVSTNNNAADFVFVSTNDNDAAHGSPVLGAPGPANLLSPIVRNDILQSGLLDPAAAAASFPNRVIHPGPPRTLLINRTIFNCSGVHTTAACQSAPTGTTATTITGLRIRITQLTTVDSPGAGTSQAVLKADNSPGTGAVTGGNLCNGHTQVQAETLQSPSVSGSGGIGSSWTVPLPAGGLQAGQCVNVSFQFDVTQGGTFSFAYNTEATTG